VLIGSIVSQVGRRNATAPVSGAARKAIEIKPRRFCAGLPWVAIFGKRLYV
jgi:hypothetical protein